MKERYDEMDEPFESWSNQILERAGILQEPICTKTRFQILSEDWSLKFERLMKDRIVTGRYRYGSMESQRKNFKSYVEKIKKRIKVYEDTGNTEGLVDAANFCMKEFEIGYHPEKHFEAKDRRD